MTTEQNVLDDLIQAITNTNTSNDDLLKVLKEGRDTDVALRDGTVVPSLTKRVVNAFSGSDSGYLTKADNLASIVDKQEARTNLDVYSKAETDSIAATPDATQTVAGKAKIATQFEVNSAISDTLFVTPKKLFAALKFHLNVTGTAPISACRSWVNFSATGGVITVKGSLNIASVTRVSAGVYTVNFSIPMPVENYAVFVSNTGGIQNSSRINATSDTSNPTIKTVNSVQVAVSGSTAFSDTANMSVGVFC